MSLGAVHGMSEFCPLHWNGRVLTTEPGICFYQAHQGLQVVDGDGNGSACGFPAIPEHPGLQHGWPPGVFSELGTHKLLGLLFSFSDTSLHSDHQPPSDHLPCSSGDLDPRDSYHSGLLGSGSSLTLAVGFFQGIPKG